MTQHTDVVVVGGGQAGLAAGYHLRRQSLDFTILDAEAAPGGSWQHMWDSLHLFSPAGHSSLPGRLMPSQPGEVCPNAEHVVDYLTGYEERYDLHVQARHPRGRRTPRRTPAPGRGGHRHLASEGGHQRDRHLVTSPASR